MLLVNLCLQRRSDKVYVLLRHGGTLIGAAVEEVALVLMSLFRYGEISFSA